MNEQCSHGHGSRSDSEPYHRIFLSVEGTVGVEQSFQYHRNVFLVNLFTATSVTVAATGNGDKDRQREVRQRETPFLTAKKENNGNSYLNRGQN